MGEIIGVLAAVLSSGLGGTAIGATRYVIHHTDPVTLGALRFGIGCLLLGLVALWRRDRWPARRDWPGIAGLGFLFFCLFPILFNASLAYTNAARGALALATLPLLTMVVGAGLGIEALTARKTAGVVIAMGGVAIALVSGIAYAPAGAWRGDLLMVGAALCMALYNVWSRPFTNRSSPVAATALAMLFGEVPLLLVAGWRGGFAPLATFGAVEWGAILYLGIVCGAFIFFLWTFALSRTTPTRVAISVTVNPVTAAIFGALLLDEPIRWNLVIGVVTVFVGIWVATTSRVTSSAATSANPPATSSRR
ncbi:DMT family transporter [Dongia sp.]|uniref:DMT family transporter n=1 Tax=Dongia sp. TaxID=1977262 RepID=UPI0035B0FDD8